MNANLAYSITRRAPVSQKALQWALRAQELINEKGVLGQDRLNLTPLSGASRHPALAFPYLRVMPMKLGPYAAPASVAENVSVPTQNAEAAGTTKVRDIFAGHVVAAFLRAFSERHPEIVLELRDEGGQFVIPMGVFVRAGRFELNRELLNASREKVLEASGDPQAGASFLWAETRALNGEFLMDVPVADDYLEVPPIVLTKDPEDYVNATVGDVATQYVRDVLREAEPVASR